MMRMKRFRNWKAKCEQAPKTPLDFPVGTIVRSPARDCQGAARAMGQDAIVMLSVHRNANAAERILREALNLDSTNALNLLRLANILRDAPNARDKILEIVRIYIVHVNIYI